MSAACGILIRMISVVDPISDHTGHRHSARYERMLRDFVTHAEPTVAALERAGWVDVALDPGIDCEDPKMPSAVDVAAKVPAGQLGTLPVRARLVFGRSATQGDVHQVIGAAALGAPLAVLVADDVEAGVSLPERLVVWRSCADVGLA